MSATAVEQKSAAENYAGAWGNRIGFGQKAALLLIDFVKAYTCEESPLYAAGVAPAVSETKQLLESARKCGVLVIHTRVSYQTPGFENGGMWVRKSPVLKCLAEERYAAVCDGVEPAPGEIVVPKQYASAFFGTSLAALLTANSVDTVIVTGCSTSGCVRATAVDGVQHGFRVIVPRECVGDRHPDPHEANLFDIDSKYGDVVGKSEVLSFFGSVKVGERR